MPLIGFPIVGHAVMSAAILAAENLDRCPKIDRL
jgi:hypothetical protein